MATAAPPKPSANGPSAKTAPPNSKLKNGPLSTEEKVKIREHHHQLEIPVEKIAADLNRSVTVVQSFVDSNYGQKKVKPTTAVAKTKSAKPAKTSNKPASSSKKPAAAVKPESKTPSAKSAIKPQPKLPKLAVSKNANVHTGAGIVEDLLRAPAINLEYPNPRPLVRVEIDVRIRFG